jgi:hypothetical protein
LAEELSSVFRLLPVMRDAGLTKAVPFCGELVKGARTCGRYAIVPTLAVFGVTVFALRNTVVALRLCGCLEIFVEYPSIAEVVAADREQVAFWWRFLPEPNTPEEERALDLIFKKCCATGGDLGGQCGLISQGSIGV